MLFSCVRKQSKIALCVGLVVLLSGCDTSSLVSGLDTLMNGATCLLYGSDEC